MGTPGDRTEIEEVVRRVCAQPVEPEVEGALGGAALTETTNRQTEEQLPPTTTTTTTMTILTPLPQLPSISEPSIKVEEGLEQARIEEYFAQSKFYSSSTELTHAQPFIDIHKLQKQSKTFLNIAQPGPSGLQTRVSKTVTKRSKKQQELTTQQQPPTQTKRTYDCPVCQKVFQNASKLAKHQLAHNGNSPYKCEHCKKSFSSKFKLVRHVLIHSDCKPFSCSVCERTFHRKDHLKNHIKVHNPSKKHYLCEKPGCKKEYTSLLSFKKHAALHAAEEGSLECQICSKTFETKEEILFHLKIHAGSRTVKSPTEKKFTCDHCDRKFFTRKDVRRHLVVHTGKRDFLCQFCPQRFGRKDHLVRHIKKSHAKSFPIKTEPVETIVKVEMTETETEPKSTPLQVAPLFFPPAFEQFTPLLQSSADDIQFLPSTSAAQPELKDLGGVLEDIETVTSHEVEEETDTPVLLDEQLIRSEEIMRLLQSADDANLPLPAFSQTFQSPPPQPPPPPPHSE